MGVVFEDIWVVPHLLRDILSGSGVRWKWPEQEIGLAPELLIKAMTEGGLAERDILPCMRTIPIDLPKSEVTDEPRAESSD